MKWFIAPLMIMLGNVCVAQQGFVVTGDNVATGFGSVSFSVGQLITVSDSTAKGSVLQGIQVPIEIVRIPVGIEKSEQEIVTEPYPNPTFEHVKVSISDALSGPFVLTLIDLSGTILETIHINHHECILSLSRYSAGTYSLRVDSQGRSIALYSIIKH